MQLGLQHERTSGRGRSGGPESSPERDENGVREGCDALLPGGSGAGTLQVLWRLRRLGLDNRGRAHLLHALPLDPVRLQQREEHLVGVGCSLGPQPGHDDEALERVELRQILNALPRREPLLQITHSGKAAHEEKYAMSGPLATCKGKLRNR